MTKIAEDLLGKLEKVDLKTIWENEVYNFKPWLAKKENLELLVDVIGIELNWKSKRKMLDCLE